MQQIKALVVKPPMALPLHLERPAVFLGGSIEMGLAEDWQKEIERACGDLDILIMNPRRDFWDTSWDESRDREIYRQQANWEFEGFKRAEMIVFYFAPQTKSAVTLLELGLFARSGKAAVCCPPSFWKKKKVDQICSRYGVQQVEDLNALITLIRRKFNGLKSIY